MCLCRFSIFSCFVRGFTTIQEFKHTKNRDAFICNSCLTAIKISFSFQLLSVNHSQKLNGVLLVISLVCIAFFLSMLLSFVFENRPFRIWLKLHSLKARNTFVIIEVSSKYSQDWFANSTFGEMSKTESIWTEICHWWC